MASITLDNHLEDSIHSVQGVQIRGFRSKQNVLNFLNIIYARVVVRFKPASYIALQQLPSPYNATTYGPRCPQQSSTLHLAMKHLFEKVSLPDQLSEEASCLNLNIYTPPSAMGSGANATLPVFVWIHGGGFNMGDNTVQFDGNHLVQRSMEVGKPIILIAINYRLNVFGFINSRELREEADKAGEVFVPNLGIHDQRIALQWIQSNVACFGGDPGQVTLCGESAGALSVLCHLKANIPLFHQAMIQSPPLLRLRSLKTAQAAFDKLVVSAGLSEDAQAVEKIRALRLMSAKQLVDASDGSFSTPIDDPDWFKSCSEHEDDPIQFWADLPPWCTRLFLGNTQQETALMLATVPGLSVEHTIAFTAMLDPAIVIPEVLRTTTQTKQDLIAWSSTQTFIAPLMTLVSAVTVRHSNIKLFVYRINCPDPFPGDLQGYSWHSYGIPFTFNQPACAVFPELFRLRDSITTATLKFLYGEVPWPCFNETRAIRYWTSEGEELVTLR